MEISEALLGALLALNNPDNNAQNNNNNNNGGLFVVQNEDGTTINIDSNVLAKNYQVC